MRAASRRDAGLTSKRNEDVKMEHLVEANTACSDYTRESVQHFERMPRKRNACEGKCWTRRRSGRVSARCESHTQCHGEAAGPEDPNVQNSHAPHRRFKNAGASRRGPIAES